jgi:solute:Na+ symporter, SSS family
MIMEKFSSILIILFISSSSIIAGWYVYRKQFKSARDYYTSGASLGPITLTLGLVAAFCSYFTFFGLASFSYRFGLGALCLVGITLPSLSYMWIIFHKKTLYLSKPMGWMSMGAVYGARYGDFVRRLIPILLLIATFPLLCAQIMATGILFKEVLGLPYWGGMFFILVVTCIYLTMGGFKGTSYAHVIQSCLFILGGIVLFGGVVQYFGGLKNIFLEIGKVRPELLSLNGKNFGYTMALTFGLGGCIGAITLPQTFMHTFGTKDAKTFKVWVSGYSFIMTMIAIFSVITGIAGFLLFPHLKGTDADAIWPLMSREIFSPWFGNILIGTVVGAGISTMDALLMGNAMNVINDFYKPLINPRATEKKLIQSGRVVMIVITLLAVLFVLKPIIPIAELAQLAFSIGGMSIFALAGGYYWKRGTGAGAAASIIGGVIMLFVFTFLWPAVMTQPAPQLGGLTSFLAALLIAGILYVVVSLFTKPPSQKVLDVFFNPALDR